MLFEVYKDGKRLMHTDDEKCIPTIDIVKSIKAAGYKILLNGKTYKVVKENKKKD